MRLKSFQRTNIIKGRIAKTRSIVKPVNKNNPKNSVNNPREMNRVFLVVFLTVHLVRELKKFLPTEENIAKAMMNKNIANHPTRLNETVGTFKVSTLFLLSFSNLVNNEPCEDE